MDLSLTVKDTNQASERLEQYAKMTQMRVCRSYEDLAQVYPDKAMHELVMPEMLGWCLLHRQVLVLCDGRILTADPSSQQVQNCRITMLNKGLAPGALWPASSEFIAILIHQSSHLVDVEQVAHSSQQDRLRHLVQTALSMEASDIHIEVRSHVARLRLRIHGELFLHGEWLPKLARQIIAVAFNKETDQASTHFNPLIPQSASMPLVLLGRKLRLRLASLPANDGFDVVMRILAVADEHSFTLSGLGYTADQVAMLERATKMPYGTVIIAGPTGSGKTTTLASCMSLISSHRKVYTIEDPVEKKIEGATQIPVNTAHEDRGFASMARTVLRMDPDVLVLGEMRDEQTAEVMMRAAMTGHLVFSTVHTQSVVDIVPRLEDLGVSRQLLASPHLLLCLVCQRLVPTLCEACSRPIEQAPEFASSVPSWQEALGEIDSLRVRGFDQTCSQCQGTGIGGRTVVAEMVWLDHDSQKFIQNGQWFAWQQHLARSGGLNYEHHMHDLIRSGHVDPCDAEKIMGPLVSLEKTHKKVL